jgi:hemolysin III
LGAALSVAALVVLVVFASAHGSARHVVSVSLFGATLVFLYMASTLYHSLARTRAGRVLEIIDHAAIYLLIAGTYTPFTLVTLRGPWGWSIFGVVWGLAVAGMAIEAFWVNRPSWAPVIVYVGMGWIVVVAIRPLLAALPTAGWGLLLAGGLTYTLGTLFYLLEKVRYMHAVWHLFVLGGSALHFFAVMFYVLPIRG